MHSKTKIQILQPIQNIYSKIMASKDHGQQSLSVTASYDVFMA